MHIRKVTHIDEHILHSIYRENMHMGLQIPLRCLEVWGPLEPAGPNHLKLVLVRKSSIYDGNVLQKSLS